MHPLEGGVEAGVQWGGGASGGQSHQVPGRAQHGGPCRHQVAQLPAHPVALHGIACRPANGIAHMGASESGVFQTGDPKSVNARIGSFPLQTPKDVFSGNSSYQAERRWRPLARRDFRIARPARVLMRWRNPCFLDRRRLLGWKVRFMDASSIQRQCISAVVSRKPRSLDYNVQHSTGRSPFFSPVENLLRSCPLHPPHGFIHTLWISLWTGEVLTITRFYQVSHSKRMFRGQRSARRLCRSPGR